MYVRMYARECVYTCTCTCAYAHTCVTYACTCMHTHVCDLRVVLTLSINVDKNSEMSIDVSYMRSNGLWLLAGMIPLKLRDMKKSSNDGRYRRKTDRPTDF